VDSPNLSLWVGKIDGVNKPAAINLPRAVSVKRSDPVYMAHAYLTKVPVTGILPFIDAFTNEGDTVLDPFAGSGMTGVAALISGRQAKLCDVSVLGQHIGTNYVNLVSEEHLRKHADEVLTRAEDQVGDVYGVPCEMCGRSARVAKTVWSVVMECPDCRQGFDYYRSLEAADWTKANMSCPECESPVSSRCRRLHENPVVDSIVCECSRTQIEQRHQAPIVVADSNGHWSPDVSIDETRQMYVASALGRHGLTSVASFYSPRNLCVLSTLWAEIGEVADEDLRSKLRFAFTAILTRASKRYQWSRQRPLNAANANYYVAPVFYEWNVFDLFKRKVDAAIRSDRWILDRRCERVSPPASEDSEVEYRRASATALPFDDHSVDYVFTDPPFGTNIFYSDMNLFQEAWMSEFTYPDEEAVIDRVDTGAARTADRYEQIMVGALRECFRVLKPGGFITLLFGNSSGKMWQLLRRSISTAGLEVVPELIALLDKGQRSVKGLASGFENTATLDLMLTLRPAQNPPPELIEPAQEDLERYIQRQLAEDRDLSPSLLYLELLRHGFRSNWNLVRLNLRNVTEIIQSTHRTVDHRTALVSSHGAIGT